MSRCLGVLFFALALLAALAMANDDPFALPDTPAGRAAAAYVAAFNRDDDDAMREFFTTRMAEQARDARPLEQRLEITRQIRAELGTLAVRKVVDTKPQAVTVVVECDQGQLRLFTFLVEPAPPHGLLGIRLEPASTEDLTPEPERTEAEALEAVRREVERRVAADEFAGVVLVARDGAPLLLQAWGMADRGLAVPNRPDTRFNLGSINKIFTKVAIAQLLEQGKLSLDARLGTLLPDYPNPDARDKVTLRHLLEMRSGIGDFFGPRFEDTPKDRLRHNREYLPLFAVDPLAFEPGTQERYSNGGFIVLGAIIERVSGMDYYDSIRTHVFAPAGMTSSDSFEADAPTPNLAQGYTRGDDNGPVAEGWRSNIYTRPARGSAAGGGYSTAEDLLRFVNALLADRLLSPPYTDWVLTGREPSADNRPPRTMGGVAWAGGAPGINALVEIDLEGGTTIVVLANLDPPSAMDLGPRIRRILSSVKR